MFTEWHWFSYYVSLPFKGFCRASELGKGPVFWVAPSVLMIRGEPSGKRALRTKDIHSTILQWVVWPFQCWSQQQPDYSDGAVRWGCGLEKDTQALEGSNLGFTVPVCKTSGRCPNIAHTAGCCLSPALCPSLLVQHGMPFMSLNKLIMARWTADDCGGACRVSVRHGASSMCTLPDCLFWQTLCLSLPLSGPISLSGTLSGSLVCP